MYMVLFFDLHFSFFFSEYLAEEALKTTELEMFQYGDVSPCPSPLWRMTTKLCPPWSD